MGDGRQTRQLGPRVPEKLAEQLEAIALVDGVSVNRLVLEALEQLVEQRRNDPDFQARKGRMAEQQRRRLDSL